MVLGLLGAGAKLSKSRIARRIADIYTTFVRAVPELLLIILIYYTGTSALKQLLLSIGIGEGIDVSPFGAAVAALGFIVGAYMTEVFRGAILAVPKGADGSRARLTWHAFDFAFPPYSVPPADPLCAPGAQ